MLSGKNKKINVLVVEDSPTQAEHLKLILEKAGYEVSAAGNGKEALLLLETTPPNLVISDIVMPEMDGYEFCRRIKQDERFKHIPVILVTVLYDPQDIIRGLECGANNFITKPYDEKYLLSRIEIVLASSFAEETETIQIGLDISFVGKRYHITANRLQILNMLLSTYETAVQKNQELTEARDQLRDLNEHLEDLVAERTLQLKHTNSQLLEEIGARKKTEEALQRKTRAYQVISGCNQFLVRASEPQDLIKEVCKILVALGGYRCAWMGYARHDKDKTVEMVAQSGFEQEYLKNLQILWKKGPHGKGPTGTAIRTGKPSVVHNIQNNPKCRSWRSEAIKRDYSTVAAFPIIIQEQAIGALTIYASEPDAFDSDEIQLLSEMTGDLAFGIESIQTKIARNQADEALRQSEERYKRVIESQTELITRFAPDSTVTFVNDAFLKYFGLNRDEIIGKKFKPEIPKENREVVGRHFASLTKEAPVASIEHRIIMPDGKVKWQRWIDRAIYDDDGNLVEYQSVGRDTTERKRAEAALRESEEKYRNLVELASAGIAIVQDGLVKYSNLGFGQIWGGAVEDLIRIPFADLIHPEKRAEVLERYNDRLAGKSVPQTYETIFLRKDGSPYPAEIAARVITYQGGPADLVIIRDITDQKRAEGALRESEEKFRAIFNHASDGMFLVDLEARKFFMCNATCAKMLDYTQEEFSNLDIAEIHPQEDLLFIHEQIGRYSRGEEGIRSDIRFKRRDGSIFDADLSPAFVTIAKKSYLLIIFKDITERKMTEQALKESEEMFRNPVEQSPVGVFLIQDNKIRYANPRLAEMVGYNRDDLLNKSFELMIFSDDLQKVRDEISKQLSGEGGAGSIEVLGVKKDGMIIHLEMYASSMIYQGRPAIYGTIIDITERKLAEEAQRASEIRYRRLFETAQDGILILDAETGQIVEVNPFLINMLGFSREQFLGKKIWEIGLFKDIVANKDNFIELQRKEYIRYEDLPLETADGRRIAVEFVSNVYVVNHTRVIQCNIRDITERKRLGDQLKESLKEKEVLLREIHHRVKNNMQVISSLLSMQSQNIKDEGIRGLFKESQNRIRSIALVHELLYRSDNLYQIEYGAYLKKMFIPLFESYSIDQRKVSIAIEAPRVLITIDKAVPCSLIINELISNSLKHAFPGDRKGAITIRFGLDAGKGEYSLDYGDNGVGLPPGLDIKTLNTLGMRLINGLTKQLGGTIEIQGTEGTHFRITFPGEGAQGGR
ncbi:MAG: PAS domain S-box protein [Methanomicrobiales archaeon]|jgi:PAS domain S-box-containing protein